MARTWPLLAALLAATGCTDGIGTDDTSHTGEVDDGCPSGMSEASDAGLLATTFLLNGIERNPQFDDSLTYQGRPAACVSADGTSLDMVFAVGDTAFGRIAMSVSQGDRSYELNGTEADLDIELFGADDPVTFSNGDWQSGTWYVETINPLSSDVRGSAVSGGQSLDTQFTVEARP